MPIRGSGRKREREFNVSNCDYLKTPANVNGTTASPWRAKIQRIGLLNMIYISTTRAWLTFPTKYKSKYKDQNPIFSRGPYRKTTTNESTRTDTLLLLTNHKD